MIKTMLTIIFLSGCTIIYSQTPKEELKIKCGTEKIKEIAEMKFTFDDGRNKKYFEYKIIRQYNTDGFLIKKLHCDSDDKP